MERGISVAAIWLGPALACWATGEPLVASAFVCSIIGTLAVCNPS